MGEFCTCAKEEKKRFAASLTRFSVHCSLLGKERMASLNPEQQQFARDEDNELPLMDVVKKYKPTVLLGVTAVGGLFTEDLIREMASNTERPIIFPLSNPTTKAECTAEQAMEWTDGQCVFASGSPFDPVHMDDGRVLTTSQCNNMYIFPGLGLGATVCGAKTVTDRMLYVFPHISKIRGVSHKVAVAVVQEAIDRGLNTKVKPEYMDDLDAYVDRKMYYPEY
ncbi:MAG: hypothetical protein SGARI_007475, partial [Bacillariaceae sp.]